VSTADAADRGNLIVMATPDLKMATIFDGEVAPSLSAGKSVIFAHGFNVVYGLIDPPEGVDVILVAPKGAGSGVRARYVEGSGVPALVGVERDATGQAWDRGLAYAWGIGCARSAILETTFRDETETDLFGEQAVLCGGIPALFAAAFDTLVAAGYPEELAYFECVHEAKIIVDLIVERGLAGMRRAISDTAQWGGLLAGPRVVGPEARAAMAEMLEEIRKGSFAAAWIAESHGGYRGLDRLRAEEARLPVEEAGAKVRGLLGFSG
jgi:ketol-acid reductoisomerase